MVIDVWDVVMAGRCDDATSDRLRLANEQLVLVERSDNMVCLEEAAKDAMVQLVSGPVDGG